ncbi:unnamed protein product [Symbiodinium sp. CCMP2592]|nr:unnamed protein product [Symbiodinium sp. CCMP2592]
MHAWLTVHVPLCAHTDRDLLVIFTRLLLALCCSALAADVEKHQALSVTKAHAPDKEAGEVKAPMPFGDLEPFGRQNAGQELTESAISETNEMVDQLERAEVAEEKRSAFRALTRLRGVALASFDGIARAQTGNIKDYTQAHQWRKEHPLHHLAEEESDVGKWAFPASADF